MLFTMYGDSSHCTRVKYKIICSQFRLCVLLLVCVAQNYYILSLNQTFVFIISYEDLPSLHPVSYLLFCVGCLPPLL